MHARTRPLRISQSNGKKEMQKQISQHWNPAFSGFAFDCKSEVRILKSKSSFSRRTHPKIILYSNANKIHFYFKGFLLGLVFKVSGTLKWPNNFGCTCLTFLPCSSVDVKHDHWSTSMCLTPDTSELWVTAATLKMRQKYKNKRYAYLSSRNEVSGSVYCLFLSFNSQTFTVIASLNCLK